MHFGWRTMLPLLIFLVTVLGIFFIYQSKAFTVRNIECVTDQGSCPDYVQAELNSHLRQSLFFTDFNQYGEEITRLAPFLARHELRKKFPDTVTFKFFSAEPVYRYTEPDGRTWLVDTVGYVIGLAEATSTDPSLPALHTVKASSAVQFRPDIHERIEPELHGNILKVFETITLEDFGNVQFNLVNDQEGYLRLADGKVAYFKLDQAATQLAKLAYLLKHFTFSTVKEPIAEIDLRYSQVILRSQFSSSSASATPKL